MGTFDIRQDAPGLLRAESVNVSIKFTRTSPTTGRISWNVPSPAAGCDATDQAYCGMLVTIDTTPASAAKIPKHGTVYTSDPVADTNLHAGDKLGTSMIIGAFYNDRESTFVDVTGLKANTAYYVSGFPVDCQYRYFIEGVHAYSTEMSRAATETTADTTGSQTVALAVTSSPSGVALTDSTGLSTTQTYEFMIQLGLIPKPRNPVQTPACEPVTPTYTISVNGASSGTYADLIDEINKQFALLDNPPQGAVAPNTNAYYWNSSSQKLFVWSGDTHTEIEVIVQATDPSVVAVGTYWFNTQTDVLSKWDGASWVATTYISQTFDPTTPPVGSVWYNGSTAYTWNGNVWCTPQFYSQATDPSLIAEPAAGTYWYDSENGALFKWDSTFSMWTATDAIQYHEDPNLLPVGTYWFDETTTTLNVLDTPSPGWNVLTNVSVLESAPTNPAPNRYWYNPSTSELFQRNGGNTAWNQLDVLSHPTDPTVRAFCELWWETDTDDLFVWDGLSTSWVAVTAFLQQSTDPILPPTLTEGTLWYNTVNMTMYSWVVNCFTQIEFINSTTNPINVAQGSVWYNPTTNVWYERGVSAWIPITPVLSASAPTALTAGSFWFNTTNNSLQQWNGVTWITVLYSPQPLTPAQSSLWFNTTNDTLMTWSTDGWIPATLRAQVELDCNGGLLFTDLNPGGLSFVNLTDINLFSSLSVPHSILQSIPGTDGVSTTPSYQQVGIGTDGTPDERLKLMNDIRYDLGYPVIDVELTNEQLDFCITKALEEIRSRTAVAYKNGFFFMHIQAETQRYLLTNKTQEMDKIVTILGIHRLTSSFLSSAHGAGVYGQIVLQHLYNMGTFDLLSYHLIAEYTETLEILFAGRITYTWNEQKRELWIHHRFPFNERMVLIEATVERSEQDIITDRWCRSWIRKYATAQAKLILSNIRGKYASLPGAGGAVTLNAGDLSQSAKEEIEQCMRDIDDYVVDRPDEFGMGTQFVLG